MIIRQPLELMYVCHADVFLVNSTASYLRRRMFSGRVVQGVWARLIWSAVVTRERRGARLNTTRAAPLRPVSRLWVKIITVGK